MGELELSFLRDGGQPASLTIDALCKHLERATKTVEIAIYDCHFETPEGQRVGTTLQALRDRGVAVRIVDHDDRKVKREMPIPPPPTPPAEYIDTLGLNVRAVASFATLMHHKYAVVDSRYLWTGSMNWSQDSFTRQDNVIAQLESPEVCADYQRDFEQLWEKQENENAGNFDCEWHELTFAGQPIRVRPFFCPGRGPKLAAEIANQIKAAKTRIRIASPVLTSGPILGALGDVVGTDPSRVRGLVDRTQMLSVLRQWAKQQGGSWKPEAFRFVASSCAFSGKNSVPWGPATLHDFMHAKMTVCDDITFVGSYNSSRSGEENSENVLMIDSKAVADLVAGVIEELIATYALKPGEGW